MSSEKKTFDFFFFFFFFFFKNLAFRLPCNQSKSVIWTKFIWLVKDYSRNICSNTVINANFHFSFYKSKETLSCQSNESTWATTIKNIFYVEANVMNKYAKFQLHPPHGF